MARGLTDRPPQNHDGWRGDREAWTTRTGPPTPASPRAVGSSQVARLRPVLSRAQGHQGRAAEVSQSRTGEAKRSGRPAAPQTSGFGPFGHSRGAAEGPKSLCSWAHLLMPTARKTRNGSSTNSF